MTDKSLIIDDEYITKIGQYSKVRGRKIEQLLNDYIKILEEIKSEAIIGGEISNSLAEYIDCVKILNNQLSTLSNNINIICNNFITDIDAADSYLF